jgi:hypothetical protein
MIYSDEKIESIRSQIYSYLGCKQIFFKEQHIEDLYFESLSHVGKTYRLRFKPNGIE